MDNEQFPHHSGMDFITDSAFPIEESQAYKSVCDVKSVEFVRIKNTNLLFVEAKTSIANPDNSPKPFRDEIEDICEKYIHSLNLFSAIKIRVYEEVLPDELEFKSKASIKFILVVRNHKTEWCRPIKMAIQQSLPKYLKNIWNPDVLVINQDMAKKYSLIN
jgi:DNA-binding protein Fis